MQVWAGSRRTCRLERVCGAWLLWCTQQVWSWCRTQEHLPREESSSTLIWTVCAGFTFTLLSLFLLLAHKGVLIFSGDEGLQARWQPQDTLLSSGLLCAVVGPDSSAESVWGRYWVNWRQVWNCAAVSCWKQLSQRGCAGHENWTIVTSIYHQQFILCIENCLLRTSPWPSLLPFPRLPSSVLYRLQERWKFLSVGGLVSGR